MVKLFKDGDHMGISTNADDEDTFREEFSLTLAELIENKTYGHDWEFQLNFWLKSYVDICCKYRGYKSDVNEKRVLYAGSVSFEYEEDLVATCTGRTVAIIHPNVVGSTHGD